MVLYLCFVCFVNQKTAYEMRISDWSSDVCSSDLDVKLGLDEVLAGEATLEQAIVKDSLSDACLLPQRLDSKGISLAESPALAELIEQEIGRASCRERVCQ